MTCTAIVFGREPRPPEAKSRLGAEIGPPRAAAVYGAMLEHVLAEALHSGLATTLSLAAPIRGRWRPPARVTTAVQCDGDLGARMRDAFDRAFADGFDAAVLVGSDLPWLTRQVLSDAAAALTTHDVVLGPARDGGYYLVGQRAPGQDLFSDVPWSHPETLAATRARIAARSLSHVELSTLSDLDTVADLQRAIDDPGVPPALRAAIARAASPEVHRR